MKKIWNGILIILCVAFVIMIFYLDEKQKSEPQQEVAVEEPKEEKPIDNTRPVYVQKPVKKVGKLEITNFTVSGRGSKYVDLSVSFTNNSDREIRYIKYNIYVKHYGKIIDVDWSNWSGSLKPGMSCVDESMMKVIAHDAIYSVEIEEIRYK